MKAFWKIVTTAVLFFTLIFSTTAHAEEMLRHTLRSALVGGVLGGLVGSAVVLLTDHPDDHLTFIPTGIGVGILLGTAYGVATSSLTRSEAFGELENGKIKFNIPTIKAARIFHPKENKLEVVQKVDLIKVRF